MTRKEELEERVEKLASRFERIGESQAKYEIVEALLQVEREVLGKVITHTQRYQQFIFVQTQSLEFDAGFRAAARVMEDWLNSQQQELT